MIPDISPSNRSSVQMPLENLLHCNIIIRYHCCRWCTTSNRIHNVIYRTSPYLLYNLLIMYVLYGSLRSALATVDWIFRWNNPTRSAAHNWQGGRIGGQRTIQREGLNPWTKVNNNNNNNSATTLAPNSDIYSGT